MEALKLPSAIFNYFVQPHQKVLIAPLNWGLGHATRDIDIIRILLKRKIEVVIATEGWALAVLKREFPQLRFLELKGYHIRYHESRPLWLQLLYQVPEIFRSIRRERRWLRRLLRTEHFDVVISDNRFGLYSSKTRCLFITHQVTIQVPEKIDWLKPTINKLNHSYIRKFNACLVPDFAGDINLAGGLSRSDASGLHLQYTGPMSRFRLKESDIRWDVLLLISGPEPQRTLLENLAEEQASSRTRPTLMVRGDPDGTEEIRRITDYYSVVDYLPSEKLEQVILSSKLVVCRSGYSTVMDLVRLKKNAVFIPTPGQSEQEHIAKHLKENKMFYSEPQNDFLLSRAVRRSVEYGANFPEESQSLEDILRNFMEGTDISIPQKNTETRIATT